MKSVHKNLDLGLVTDVPAWELPPGAMTDSNNVRYRDGAAEKIRGHSQLLGDLSATANWIETITDGSNVFYAYADLGNIWGTDGSTHTLISTISYSAGIDLSWTGGAYHGYLVLTDGVLDPQTWQPGLGNRVAGMDSTAGWPASTKCEVIRPFKDFLVALRVTESGTYNPRLLRWSESALVGALPTTWDYTDPTNDSGRTELGQTTDLLVDCLPLRDVNMIYKEHHSWIMEYIGGSDVFSFRQVFSQVGLLSENCVKPFKHMHFLVTDHDVVVHDGVSPQSILNKRRRRWLFTTLDSSNYKRSFVVADYGNREMLFCFPEEGQDYANLALVWSWMDDNLYVRDLGSPMTHGVSGILPSDTPTTFDGKTVTFDADVEAFDAARYNAGEQYVVFTDSASNKAYQNDDTHQFDGAPMGVYLERESLPLTKDISVFKRVMRVYPHILGTTGDTVQIKIGSREAIDGLVTWSSPQTFTIGTDYKLEFRVSGRLFDFRLDYTGSNPLRVFGYEIEFEEEGFR
jgi:hypothetical protein